MVEGEEVQSIRTTVFKVEAKAIHYSCAPGIYKSSPQVQSLQHMSVGLGAIHISWHILPAGEMLGRVDGDCSEFWMCPTCVYELDSYRSIHFYWRSDILERYNGK